MLFFTIELPFCREEEHKEEMSKILKTPLGRCIKAGAAAGAVVGLIGGPIGAAIGGFIGGTIGVIVGLFV